MKELGLYGSGAAEGPRLPFPFVSHLDAVHLDLKAVTDRTVLLRYLYRLHFFTDVRLVRWVGGWRMPLGGWEGGWAYCLAYGSMLPSCVTD